MRTGHKTQGVALFTRMGDRFSTWDVSNGLQSIIPTLLTSSVAGYPFCLPDMIGELAWHAFIIRAQNVCYTTMPCGDVLQARRA